MNMAASFRCICMTGYNLDESGVKCVGELTRGVKKFYKARYLDLRGVFFMTPIIMRPSLSLILKLKCSV